MRRLLQFVLFTSLPAYGFSQLQISAPATVCAAQNAAAAVTASVNNATIYNWTINPPESVNPGSSPSNTLVNISFTTCGSHTLTCDAYNGTSFLSSISKTINVICPGVTVTPATQTICAGSIATLAASGAGSYTWNTSQVTSVINPAPLATTVYSVIGNVNSCLGTAAVYVANTPTILSTANAVCANFNATLSALGSPSYTWTGSTIINPVVQSTIAVGPGSYTVSSAPGSALCSASINIGIAPPINITYSMSTYTTCIMQNYPYTLSKPVVITAFGASTYSWTPYNPVLPISGPVVTVRPNVSTCYTVTGFTSACSASAVACVSVIPQFMISVVGPLQFCRYLPGNLSLTVGPQAVGTGSALSYSWNFPAGYIVSNPNAQTITLAANLTSTYSAEVTDARGCISAPLLKTLYVTVCSNAVIERSADQGRPFLCFPNPTNDMFFIKEKNGSANNLTVELSDFLGKRILQTDLPFEVSENSWRLDLKDIGKGIYFVKLFSGGQLLQESKVIKQ